MEQKRRFKAKIMDKEYTIVGQKSSIHLNTVVDVLNRQLSQLESIDPDLSVADRSVLIAINAISDQLIQEQEILELEEKIAQLQSYAVENKHPHQTDLFGDTQTSSRVPFNREK